MIESANPTPVASGAPNGAWKATKWLIVIGCVLIFSGIALIFMPYEDPNYPHSGDVVAAQFVVEPLWRAGETSRFRIRMLATDQSGNPRRLDFRPSLSEAPRAQVVFSDKEGNPVAQAEVDSWSVRCYGVMTNQNIVSVPANAHQADLRISIPQPEEGLASQQFERRSMPVEPPQQAP